MRLEVGGDEPLKTIQGDVEKDRHADRQIDVEVEKEY